jgi:hypothetical protein
MKGSERADGEFQNDMVVSVVDCLLGSFDANLWGVSIDTDRTAAAVVVHFWFAAPPSLLDRGELGEFLSAFDGDNAGEVDIDVRWTVAAAGERDTSDRAVRWVYLARHPATPLDLHHPDDVDF